MKGILAPNIHSVICTLSRGSRDFGIIMYCVIFPQCTMHSNLHKELTFYFCCVVISHEIFFYISILSDACSGYQTAEGF